MSVLKRKKEVTFLKKSNQKTFAHCGPWHARANTRRTESFLLPQAGSLFFKQEALSYTSSNFTPG